MSDIPTFGPLLPTDSLPDRIALIWNLPSRDPEWRKYVREESDAFDVPDATGEE